MLNLKKTLRKITSVLLVLVMLLGIAPTAELAGIDLGSVFAGIVVKAVGASGNCGTNTAGDNCTWELTTDGKLIIKGDGAMKSYGQGNSPWYSYKDSIVSVSVESGVTNVGNYAFYALDKLSTVTIANSVISVGTDAFRQCTSLAKIVIPDSITTIGDRAFYGCSALANVTIGSGVKTIGERAFYNCSALSKIVIPDSVITLSSYAFSGCSSLTSVTLSKNISLINSYTFSSCSALPKITLPEGITTIDVSAFNGCSGLSTITIPDSVATIGDSAFNSCSGLATVKFGSGLSKIGNYAFQGCSGLGKVVLPDGVATIGNYTFSECTSLATAALGAETTKIGTCAFYGCSTLASINLGESMTSIGTEAFRNCISLTGVTIPESVTAIGARAFMGCTALSKAVIGDGVTKIPERAFYGCSALKTLTIGNSVTSIGEYAFSGCSALVSVKIPDSTTAIENYAFSGCSGMTTLEIGNSVTNIGDYAFQGCASLLSVTIPDSTTAIGRQAFYRCTSLTNIKFGEDLAKIGEQSFYNCSSLKSVVINKNLTSIGGLAFYDCTLLQSFTVDVDNIAYASDSYGVLFNKEMTTLIQYPIGNARKTYTIPESVVTVYDYAFYNADYLTEVIAINSSLATIGQFAFSDCASLNHIYLPKTLSSVNYHAFSSTKLTEVHYKGTEEEWGLVTIYHSNNYLENATKCFNCTCLDNKPIEPECFSVTYAYTGTVPANAPALPASAEFETGSSVTVAATPALDGYTFNGWYFNGTKVTSFVMPATDVTLEGKWIKNEEPSTKPTEPSTNLNCGHETTSKVVIDATCKVAGMEYVVCATCGEKIGKPVVIPVLPHKPVTVVTVKATCTNEGKEHDECSVCGDKIGDERTVAKLPHTPGELVVEVEPTAEREGKKVRRCTVCKTILEEVIIPKNIVIKDEETGVEIEYPDGSQEDNIEIVVSESFDGKAFNLINAETPVAQSLIYDIKMTVNGYETQPKGKIKVRIPVPKGYNPTRSFIYYVNTENGTVEKFATVFKNGYLEFETTHFSYYAVVEESNTSVTIKTPSATKISYRDSIILHAEIEGKLPEGAKVVWSADNDNFEIVETSVDGTACTITPASKGDTVFTATVVDKDGNEISSDTQTMTSNASIFWKIIAFFKMLFGLTKVIPEASKNIF